MLSLQNIVEDKLVMVVAPQSDERIECIRRCAPRDMLVFERRGSGEPERRSGYIASQLEKLSDIAMTNCQVAMLDVRSSAVLNSKHNFWKTRLEKLLVPKGAWSFIYLAGLMYYQRTARLSVVGEVAVGEGPSADSFLVVEVKRGSGVHNRRVFAPHDWSPGQIFERLSGLDYVLLRSIDTIEAGSGFKDIDILVSDNDLAELRERFSKEIGLFQFEVYAETGIMGHDFQSVPYFFPGFARRILASAKLRKSGIRVPSARFRYLSLAYHLVFHGKSRHVSKAAVLSEDTFSKPRHYQALMIAAREAGFGPPRTFDDIDRHLIDNDSFPGVDILGFYGRRNQFIVERYLHHRNVYLPGLATFFVRDFGGAIRLLMISNASLTRNLKFLIRDQ